MFLGHWIEMKSIMGASRALEELAKLMPSTAHKITSNGELEDVQIEELKVGDKVLIKPGEKIPVDGEVVDGETSVNESMLTGESKPVFKKKGAEVIGGSVNGEGSITVIVKKTGKDSYLAQVIDLVRQAQESKSKTQDLANRAAFWLTLIALSVGVFTFFLWLFISEKDLAFAIERTVTVMVIACPHALGLAVPLVVAMSTSIAASNGFLIRNRTAFEQAKNIKAIIFDKIGTLTEGRFGVTDIVVFSDSVSKDKLLSLASSIEIYSEHPIAQGIVSQASKTYPVKDFKAIPGKSAEGNVESRNIKVVSPGYLREHNIIIDSQKVKEIDSQGKTIIFVLEDNTVLGAIALADIIRSESKKTVTMLKKMGIKTIMLTGDNSRSLNG